MLKKMLIFLSLVLTAVYLTVAVTALNAKPDGQTCTGVELMTRDSVQYNFVNKREIMRMLDSKKLSPIGQEMSNINTRRIEEELKQHPLVGNVECYRTTSNRIGIKITQKVPVLRVMAENGENYYIDDHAQTMPMPNSTAHVAVATGNIDKAFARKELYELAMFLQRNPMWKAQVQQINVTKAREIELVPRVGEHIVFLGKPGNYENKFEKLKTFYKKALNRIGWNKYERISLEFDNKIICTKKKK